MSEGLGGLWATSVEVEVETDQAEEDLEELKQKCEEVDEETEKTVQITGASLRHLSRAIFGVVGITVSVLEAVGITLDPFGQAIIGMITSTISALQSIAVSMGSNPITAAFAVVTAGAAIWLSALALNDAWTGVDRSKGQIRQAQSILRMLHSSMTLARAGGW